MKLREIVELLEGSIVCGEDLGEEIEYAIASDLMSDVLTIKRSDFVLLTGLANTQSVRTAEMSDLKYLIFVRGKEVTKDMIEMALDNDMVVLSTPFSMFKAAGLLFAAGIKPVY